MTEFDKADTNGSGTIERSEWDELALEDRRLEIADLNFTRHAERRFTGFALAGMLVYSLVILLASVMGFDKAATLITEVASVYVLSASAVVASFMGFNMMSAKADKNKTSVNYGDRSNGR